MARNAIDHFVLARLEQEGLSPSPAADRATLIRRPSLDLTGLPPELEQVESFVADDSSAGVRQRPHRAPRHDAIRWPFISSAISSSRRTRSSIGGCVENQRSIPRPENGFTM